MKKVRSIPTQEHARTLALGIQAPYNKTKNIDSYFDEFLHLIDTNEVTCEKTIFMKLRTIDNAYFLTSGKLQELKKICDDNNIEHVILSETLIPQQERNLNEILDCKIFDRTMLILEIFEKHAVTAEGKTQVQIAMLQHRRSRVSGKGLHMAQQSGVIGFKSGPGETAKERELRYIDQHILKYKRRLEAIDRARSTQRKKRFNAGVKQFCLIGYTNAGKSTLLNRLTKSNVLAQDKLFATLDTTTRELFVDSKKRGVISDTVGFIQQLPHKLINAFKSTLSELQYADLLLHVIDASNPNWHEHIDVVRETLDDLQVHKPMVYIFNKMDLLEKELASKEFYARLNQFGRYQPNVFISATDDDGVAQLIEFLSQNNI